MRLNVILFLLIAVALVTVALEADVPGLAAAKLWPTAPAPWEKVTPVYFPDRDDGATAIEGPPVGSVADCRAWVDRIAAERPNPLARGDYECRVGLLEDLGGGFKIYRFTDS